MSAKDVAAVRRIQRQIVKTRKEYTAEMHRLAAERADVVRRLRGRMPVWEIAAHLGVTPSRVYQILARR